MRLARLAGMLGMVAATAAAQPAADPEAVIVWRCWYSGERGPAVACRLLQAPDAVLEVSPGSGWPPMLGRIRSEPGWLRDDVILIPLHGPPVEMPRTVRLARAVMCGANPSCTIDFRSGNRD